MSVVSEGLSTLEVLPGCVNVSPVLQTSFDGCLELLGETVLTALPRERRGLGMPPKTYYPSGTSQAPAGAHMQLTER
jgi:hypothetical protein